MEFGRCLRVRSEADTGAAGERSAVRSIELVAGEIRRRADGFEDRPDPLAPELEAGGGTRLEPAELLALLSPRGGEVVFGPVPAESPAPTGTIEVAGVAALVERWVRRVALGGDSRRGVARLDIGSGRLAGAELTVVAEASHVSVELSLPPGQAAGALAARLRRRLEQRGFETEVLVR
jgi:hypothetical protein